MCGIVGYVGGQQAAPLLLEGLARLEYRGYDSAGRRRPRPANGAEGAPRQAGRVRDLAAACPSGSPASSASATPAGPPTAPANDVNAHPHLDATGEVAVVHNGIIDNAAALRAELDRRRRRAPSPRPTPRCSPT